MSVFTVFSIAMPDLMNELSIVDKKLDEEEMQELANIKPCRIFQKINFLRELHADYYSLFKKICRTHADIILNERVRISNKRKYGLLLSSYLRHTINWI